jgi:hypothetical protein
MYTELGSSDTKLRLQKCFLKNHYLRTIEYEILFNVPMIARSLRSALNQRD